MEKFTAESRVKRHIEEWKQKLIDLTRRNRLTYFKKTKSSTLVISQPDSQTVFDRLVIKEAKWEFWFPPKEEEEANQDSIPGATISSNQEQESQFSILLPKLETNRETINSGDVHSPEKTSINKSKSPKSNELVIEGLSREELEKVIKNLYRRSSSDYEERGVRILYLALGMLEWKERNSSEIIQSPLILVPVELSRESARDPFRLLPAGEDIVLNPALQVKLRTDFNMELPPLPDDWEEVSLYDYFNNVADTGGKLN